MTPPSPPPSAPAVVVDSSDDDDDDGVQLLQFDPVQGSAPSHGAAHHALEHALSAAPPPVAEQPASNCPTLTPAERSAFRLWDMAVQSCLLSDHQSMDIIVPEEAALTDEALATIMLTIIGKFNTHLPPRPLPTGVVTRNLSWLRLINDAYHGYRMYVLYTPQHVQSHSFPFSVGTPSASALSAHASTSLVGTSSPIRTTPTSGSGADPSMFCAPGDSPQLATCWLRFALSA